MSTPSRPGDDELFNKAFDVLLDDSRPIDNRIETVLRMTEDTDVPPRDVLVNYGAHLRSKNPLDGSNRRVITLLSAAERAGFDITMSEIIDTEVDGGFGERITTQTSSDDTNINIRDTSKAADLDSGRVSQSTRPDTSTERDSSASIDVSIDFTDVSAVKSAAVNLYNNDSLNYDDKRRTLVSLLEEAQHNGLDISSSDIRAAIQEDRRENGEVSEEELRDEVPDVDEDVSERLEKEDQSRIRIVDWSVSSTGIHAGESVKVTVELENTGDVAGLKDVKLIRNHNTVETEVFDVAPGETTSHSFHLTFNEGGQHLLQVNDEAPVQITVIRPADITITDVIPEAERVPPDEPVDVDVTVANTGDIDDEIDVELALDDRIYETRTLAVAGNDSLTETFTIEVDRPGDYTLAANSFETPLVALRPASVNVTDYRLSSTGVETGEELTVAVDIENTGDLPGTIAVALYANGSAVETKSIEVAGGDTQTAKFTTSFNRTGTQQVTINNREPTDVTVLKPAHARVIDADVVDTELSPDDSLFINANVHNAGDLSTTIALSISIDGVLVSTQDVPVDGNTQKEITLGPGTDYPVDFDQYLDQPGEHTVSINDLPGIPIEVLSPADVMVRYYALSEDEVIPGEEFEVDVEIENEGDMTGETDVIIYSNGDILDTHSITVDGNSDKRGSFPYTFNEPGTYTIRVNSLEPSTLTVRNTGTFEITELTMSGGDDDTGLSFTTGDELEVTVAAENTAGLSTEHELILALDGVPRSMETVYLDGNQSKSVSLTHTLVRPGQYDVEVDDEFLGTITVSMPLETVSLDNEEYAKSISRCIKIRENGKRCSRTLDEDELVCWQHDDYLEQLDVEDIRDCMAVSDEGDVCQAPAEEGGLVCSAHNPLDTAFVRALPEDIEHEEPPESGDHGESDSYEPHITPPEPTETATADTNPEANTTLDRDVADEDGHSRVLDPPSLEDTGIIPDSQNSRTLVRFDFVLDENDDAVPDNVDAAGMVVDGDEYIGIAKAKPRSWSIHTHEEKRQIIKQYRSLFLGSVDFPVQIVCYPTEFDISEHLRALQRLTDPSSTRKDESYLLNIGRQLYPQWLREYISDSQMKQRNFYIIVRVKPEQLNRFRNNDDGLAESLEDRAPALAKLLNAITPGDSSDSDTSNVTRGDCLVELQERLQRLKSGLSPMGVEVEPLTNRDRVMSLLYEYYNNEHPIVDNFDVATRSEFAPSLEIDEGEFEMDALTDIHYEEYRSSEESQ